MKDPIQKYFQVGTIQWMTHPPVNYPILDSVKTICCDEYFSALEITHIEDQETKDKVRAVSYTHLDVYKRQGQLGLSYTNPREEIRREAIRRSREIIDFAGFLGANINIGRVRGQYCSELSREETENLAVEAFRELADYGAPKNVKIALETVTIMQTNFINTLAEGAAMVDRVDRPNFRLMMDIFHLNLEEKDIYEAIRRYSPYNIHVHLADNNRRYPGHCGLDFEKILTTFKECGYDGNFCTEIFQIPSMEEAAAGAIRHLRPIADRVYGRKV